MSAAPNLKKAEREANLSRLADDVRTAGPGKLVAIAPDGSGWMVISAAFTSPAACAAAGWTVLTEVRA